MLLTISTSTFLLLATMALVLWASLVLFFTGRFREKKKARPTPTLQSFFQPTAGKTAIDVPMPMASYKRSELLQLAKIVHTSQSTAFRETLPNELPSTEPVLDDPVFAPAEASNQVEVSSASPPLIVHSASVSQASGFHLSVDRQLLSRLLSDDTLCEEFEQARVLTLARQQETGRPYRTLFREAVADKPDDVQAILLNLLTEEEEEDFDRALPSYP